MVPEGWEQHHLAEICELINGRGFKPHEWDTEGYPIIRIQNLNGSDEFNYFNGDFNPKILVRYGELLFAWSGSRGTSFGPHIWNGPDAVLNYHTWRVVPKEQTSRDFLVQYLRHITTEIEATAHGASALVHTQKDTMERRRCVLPPLPEQRKIAEILSTWDRAIETTEALLTTARTQKRALMQQLLTGKRRFPEFEGQPWRDVRLGEIAKVIVSNVDKKSDPSEVPVRLCNYTDVYKRDAIDPSQDFMEATATTAQIKRFCLKRGDVVITKDSETADDIAMPTFVQEAAEDLVCGYHLAIVRPSREADGRFLKFYFELPRTRHYFGTRANGAIRFGLTIDGIEGAVVQLPPVEEQRRIAAALANAEVQIKTLMDDIEKLRTEKKALMQQLLTGKRRVVF